MKRIVVAVVIILLGLGALLYPMFSNMLFEQNSSQIIQSYTDSVSEQDAETLSASWEEAERYNESLTGVRVEDPYIEQTGYGLPENYRGVLNVNGIMGYLEIPRISVDLPIYHGVEEQNLTHGLGHVEGSTLPIGGVNRHSVLTSHSGVASARLLTDLPELQEGDMFYVHVLGKTLAYQVDQIRVIEPNTTDDLMPSADQDYCTLMTCTPYGINSHRLLVRGVRVAYDPEQQEMIQPLTSYKADDYILWIALGTAGVMGIVIVIVVLAKRRRTIDER